jgi:hypothetical protein
MSFQGGGYVILFLKYSKYSNTFLSFHFQKRQYLHDVWSKKVEILGINSFVCALMMFEVKNKIQPKIRRIHIKKIGKKIIRRILVWCVTCSQINKKIQTQRF